MVPPRTNTIEPWGLFVPLASCVLPAATERVSCARRLEGSQKNIRKTKTWLNSAVFMKLHPVGACSIDGDCGEGIAGRMLIPKPVLLSHSRRPGCSRMVGHSEVM